MRILMVNKFLYPRGGAETYFLKIGEYLCGNGHDVEYFGMYDEKNTVGNTLGEYTANMDFHQSGPGKLLYPFKIIYSFEAKKKISKVIDAYQPDIVHLNNINFQLTPSIIDAIDDAGIPVVQTVHDYQMLCPNHLFFDVLNLRECDLCLHGSKFNCVRTKCIHGSSVRGIVGAFEAVLYQKRNTYDKVALYICPSRFLESKLLEIPLFKGKTKAIHNFIELPDDSLSDAQKKDYILFFGRLSPEKGIGIFLECCRMLPDVKFVIAGTGPQEDMCRGLSNVEYVGFQTGDALHRLIAEARLSVLPAVWHENCPLAILESQSLGTPVIATNMGGIPELIEDGVTGIIIKKKTAEAFSDAISALLSNDCRIGDMTSACFKKREGMISLPAYCAQLEALYHTVLK